MLTETISGISNVKKKYCLGSFMWLTMKLAVTWFQEFVYDLVFQKEHNILETGQVIENNFFCWAHATRCLPTLSSEDRNRFIFCHFVFVSEY
jgi:hypothetical protein